MCNNIKYGVYTFFVFFQFFVTSLYVVVAVQVCIEKEKQHWCS